jgi:hypothetical protein
MCVNNNELIFFIVYLLGFLMTWKLFDIQIYKLYKESKSDLDYNEWTQDTDWGGIPILLIFCWPLALVILLLIRIIQLFKRNDK